jgi:hypothetical protein
MAEECAEVAHRASKALRFGLDETQPLHKSTNAQRIIQEMEDLLTVTQMLIEEGSLTGLYGIRPLSFKGKREKIEKYLRYSEKCGTLDAGD